MEAKPKRRWYQFGLRTLMIVVTLLAVPLGYVGWQAKIVRERKAMTRELYEAGAVLASAGYLTRMGASQYYIQGKYLNPPYPSVSLVRRLLGDDFVVGIVLPLSAPPNTESRAGAVFPEALIQRDVR